MEPSASAASGEAPQQGVISQLVESLLGHPPVEATEPALLGAVVGDPVPPKAGRTLAENLVGETVGRAAEGFVAPLDIANVMIHYATTLPKDVLTMLSGEPDPKTREDTSAMPGSAMGLVRSLFGNKPVEELGTLPERVGATAWQVLGPAAAGGAVQQARLLGERGALGPIKEAPPVAETAPVWRDPLETAVQEWPQERGTAAQLRAHVARYAGTKERVEPLLAGREMITKEEALAGARETVPRLEEKVYGELGDKPTKAWFIADRGGPTLGTPYTTQEEAQSELETIFPGRTDLEVREGPPGREFITPATKFSQYQTPGGENYRELVLKLPTIGTESLNLDDVATLRHDGRGYWYEANENGERLLGWDAGEPITGGQPRTAEEARANALELVGSQLRRSGGQTFEGGHFGEPNELAHVRFNERRDVDGVFGGHIEEFQSDWHRKLREWEEFKKTSPELHSMDVVPEVPDAPFKGSWHQLLMKRMIRWAVDHGWDQITWTTGQQQIDRYNLALKDITHAREVPNIYHDLQGNGWLVGDPRTSTEFYKTRAEAETAARKSGNVDYYAWQGDNELKLSTDQAKELKKLLGERASQLATDEGIDLSKEPLEIGGTWARNLYDKAQVNDTNRLVKKWGGRVDETEIPTNEQMGRYTGPEYTADQLDSRRYEIYGGGVRLSNQIDHMIHRMHAGMSFKDAIQQEGSPEMASMLGGQMSIVPKHETVHRLRITPQMRDAAKRGMELSEAPSESAVA